VVKPAEDACLSVLRVAELAAGVGLPAGALNIVTGLGQEAGAALVEHRASITSRSPDRPPRERGSPRRPPSAIAR
jgi:delta 1-pyrroline-5-carboxylate dehydrogenase